MCSILFTNKEITGPKVNELLQKRGPDGIYTQSFGEYNFIHNLLSLTGNVTKQPVEQEGIIVTFNGEIYNYLDIDPSAKSDIYSIITAYKKYGDKFIQYLEGEFALILLDNNKDWNCEILIQQSKSASPRFQCIHKLGSPDAGVFTGSSRNWGTGIDIITQIELFSTGAGSLGAHQVDVYGLVEGVP